MSQEEFVSRSKLLHNNKYDYSNFKFTNTRTKSLITCPIHGDFLQNPNHHLKGRGCMKCRGEETSRVMRDGQINYMSYRAWGDMATKSKSFESFKVYIVTCSSDEESFIKVGRTYSSVKNRFKSIPYNFNINNIITKDDPIEVCVIEQEIKTKLKGFKYETKKLFKGQFECFSIDALHSGAIDELIKNYN